ncbi:YciI family protein [Aquimarina pacifica]|uniref:YciI family protein n=1 Tax=Aquimarina pacifica TaxID=1296415 RepID=UPI000472E325|nr:phenylalanyl-tRNA synthetase subunit alpha [Aquimarina pacifica]
MLTTSTLHKFAVGFLLFFVLLSSCKEQKPENPEIVKEEKSTSIVAPTKPSIASIKNKLIQDGFKIFDYVDEESGDTVIMQQYFIAFLKRGPNRSENKIEVDSLQKLHLEHLGKMYKEGHADISGPFGDDGDIRGITIYNTPTQKIADSLANSDPMVKSGRLIIEMHPWWAAKGFPLR